MTNKNSLINEAFNLNTNFTNIQPLTVLPPSINHFQPISHSRTPSMEVKDLVTLKPATNLFPGQAKTPSSYFDQPSLNAGSFLTESSSALTKPPQLFKPVQPFESLKSEPLLSNSASASNMQSMIPNLSSPLSSQVLPPTSLPPPPPTLNASGSSNPYAAKGALNKKVYDKVVNIAPIAPVNSFLNNAPIEKAADLFAQTTPNAVQPLINSPLMPTSTPPSLFMPPSSSAQQIYPQTPQSVASPQFSNQ